MEQSKETIWLSRYLQAVLLIEERNKHHSILKTIDREIESLLRPGEEEREQILQIVRSSQTEPIQEKNENGKSQIRTKTFKHARKAHKSQAI